MKAQRILMLMHEDLVPPDATCGIPSAELEPMKTELHVFRALSAAGHEVQKLGIHDELGPIRHALKEFEPTIAFNLLEELGGQAIFDQHVVSYLELIGLRYTGCNPRGLVLARDKALAKKIVSYHRIAVPDFLVVPRGRKMKRPKRLAFPLIVKSLVEEASLGISQASIVDTDSKLQERVEFIHDRLGTDALVESFIDGRELYVPIMGNDRLQVLPLWELVFGDMPDDASLIATRKAKWDRAYQQRHKISSQEAKDIDGERVQRQAKRIYRALGLSGYARLDFRMRADGTLVFLEANPNPQIAEDEDFADSARAAGISYTQLLDRVVALGLNP